MSRMSVRLMWWGRGEGWRERGVRVEGVGWHVCTAVIVTLACLRALVHFPCPELCVGRLELIATWTAQHAVQQAERDHVVRRSGLRWWRLPHSPVATQASVSQARDHTLIGHPVSSKSDPMIWKLYCNDKPDLLLARRLLDALGLLALLHLDRPLRTRLLLGRVSPSLSAGEKRGQSCQHTPRTVTVSTSKPFVPSSRPCPRASCLAGASRHPRPPRHSTPPTHPRTPPRPPHPPPHRPHPRPPPARPA